MEMKENKNRYSIRKYSVGASSILIATLLFLGAGNVQAAESSPLDNHETQSQQVETIHNKDQSAAETTVDNKAQEAPASEDRKSVV